MKSSGNTYYDKMHRLGKFVTVGSILVFCGVPLVVCLYYGIMPKIGDLLLAENENQLIGLWLEGQKYYCGSLREAAQEAGVTLKQVSVTQQNHDHPILWTMEETSYLKFYIFQIIEA